MNHVPRFMKEYAAYQKRRLQQAKNREARAWCIDRINNAVRLYQRGALSIDETMQIINNAGYKGGNENV